MRRFLVSWIVNTTALLIVVHVVSGITVDRWQTTFIAALVIGLFNAILRPVLIFLTLPLTVLTLGLFTLVINGFLFYLASYFVRGFQVMSFGSAFWGALLFSIVAFFLNLIVRER
jgi:putative membrane protein